jgi:hypothetical protein
MPLAEMMTDGQRDRDSRIDCCTVSTSVTPSTSALHLAWRHPQQRACRRYSAVAATAIGLSTKTGTCAGMAPAALQPLQQQQQRLRAPDRERRQQHRAAALMVRVDDVGQLCGGVLRRVRPVAVGRFDDQHVGLRHGLGRRHQQVALAAEVATEHQPVAAAIGQVTLQAPSRCRRGVSVTPSRPMPSFAPGRQRLETGDGPLRVGLGVQRQRLLVARIAVAVGAPRVLFLQVGAVHQQHRGQVAGGGRGVDGTAVALLDQRRQVAAVVQVGVAQHHGVDVQQLAWQRRPVAFAVHLEALEQAAVQQHAVAGQFDQVARPGHAVGGAEEVIFMPGPCPATSPTPAPARPAPRRPAHGAGRVPPPPPGSAARPSGSAGRAGH